MQIRLFDYVRSDRAWGSAKGRQVHNELLALVQANPQELVFQVSLAGVRQTDTSFARESVIALAKRFREQRGFCLLDVEDEDLFDNWDAVASRQAQPLILWEQSKPRILGGEPPTGLKTMFDYVLAVEATTTSDAASLLKYSVPNASNKLKQLVEEGFILRREKTALSGGIEFEYFSIR